MKLLTTFIICGLAAGWALPAWAGQSIQVGAFRFDSNARAAADTYRSLTGEMVYVDAADGFYRVRIGDYPSTQRAKLRAEQLQREGKIPAFCIVERPGVAAATASSGVPVAGAPVLVAPQPGIRTSSAAAPAVLAPPDLPVLAPAAVEDVGVGRKVADVALKFQGIPYVYGGNTIFGFDCSGFTKAMYSLAGVSIPRVAQDQFGYGRPVLREDIQPGDLVFFGTGPDNISHVGMAIGDGKFVHAPRTGLDITTTSLDSEYYSARFQGARRPYAQTLLAGSGTPATTASTGSSEHNAY